MDEEDGVKNEDQEGYRCVRCFKALFGIPCGPGALLTLRTLMPYLTSSGLVNLGSLAGAMK
jgi:hypothetical protein